MEFDAEENWRIARVRLALALHVTPAEVDAMPLQDVHDVVAVLNADKEYARLKAQK